MPLNASRAILLGLFAKVSVWYDNNNSTHYYGKELQIRHGRLGSCMVAVWSLAYLRAALRGHIPSVSGVCNMTCHLSNTHADMQLVLAWTDNSSYRYKTSLKGDGKLH